MILDASGNPISSPSNTYVPKFLAFSYGIINKITQQPVVTFQIHSSVEKFEWNTHHQKEFESFLQFYTAFVFWVAVKKESAEEFNENKVAEILNEMSANYSLAVGGPPTPFDFLIEDTQIPEETLEA